MTFTPLCPNCNKKMEIHIVMDGEHWYCPDYAYCGGIIMEVENVRI
jgi:Zn-finger nucleic acid-binding protein